MRRVVVTGMGVVSSIGANANEVTASLREARSGIVAAPEYAELGFRSQVHAPPNLDWESMVDRRAARVLAVPKAMSSGASATLSTWFKIRGQNYSISSACATSTHCIGAAYEQILMGKQDVMFAGGVEELDWTLSVLFDAMGAMSSNFNDRPAVASRAYDKDRDGFVIAGGAGVVVLEDYERAKARGAKIYAEIIGYAANSDGYDMVQPSGEGAERCMKLALQGVNRPIDYLNPHGTSTPIGDIKEMEAVRQVFGAKPPLISSTKSLTGHSLGAAGAQEAIYSLLMLNNGFVAESAHIENLDPAFEDLPIVCKRIDKPIETVMSNSFGFGGTNGCLVMTRV
jgi:3-oxoacyl-[acyl-carrier-protein] synthase-1